MKRILPLLLAFNLPAALSSEARPLEPLRVSENRRFLVTGGGQPFFYLGDTAWELFHRLDREQAIRYLDDRQAKGFTVIQAVALAELDGLRVPNAYGHLPLLESDPSRPDVKPGPENDYWDHVDFIISEANQRGLYIGLLPTWGDKWNKKWGQGPEVFTAANAESYGKWLGERYREAAVIWMVGGDRPIETDAQREIVRQTALGLRKGDGGRHLITFHPSGGQGSADYFHAEPWLDFNLRQNGHAAEWNGRYEKTRVDYERHPVKPVIDGEPVYEDHPLNFKPAEQGYSLAADVRRALYWNLFGGACGHTYGHHSVWQMHDPKHGPAINHALMPWEEALSRPGAAQMRHAKELLLSRPFLTRIPDDQLIVADLLEAAVPGFGTRRFTATRDSLGSYAMVYVPVGRSLTVRMDKISGPQVKAWWFNPRDGSTIPIGTFESKGERSFSPPTPGELLDWVLVLDDAEKKFPPPGTVADQ